MFILLRAVLPHNLIKLFLFALFATTLAPPATLHAAEPMWQEYAALLGNHLDKNSTEGITLAWLNYPALQKDPAYNTTVQELATFPVATLSTKQEKLAFYINAYNILAIKVVLDNWPLTSIKDAGSWFNPVWKKPAGKIDGKTVTLHHIEHEILRPMGDPRVHMAIVCASLSCPDLRNEPFNATNLESQLDDQAQRFINNTSKGVEGTGRSLRVSKIFDWFAQDFTDPVIFIRHYRQELPLDASITGYLPYNWSLNGNIK